MKRKMIQVVLVIFTLFTINSSFNTITAQGRHVKKSFDIKGSDDVILRVEIEYAIGRKGASNNLCEAQFIVTNIGTVPYKWVGKEEGNENRIVFEFTTSDGKILEVSKPFFVNLQPGKTSGAETVYVEAGLYRYCKSVSVVRLESLR